MVLYCSFMYCTVHNPSQYYQLKRCKNIRCQSEITERVPEQRRDHEIVRFRLLHKFHHAQIVTASGSMMRRVIFTEESETSRLN